ncbi:MAG: zinc transport system substrate-binding protein [Campylobacterota bacterium]|nr:zinc transport system substrate-binding protein [Campylobacterota bacterium]
MSKKRLLLVGILFLLVGAAWVLMVQKQSLYSAPEGEKPIVCVSTFTLYEVSTAIAGNTLEISPIVPLGSDAHMFSPSPSKVAQISTSAFFIYNGAGFETWAQALKNTLPKTIEVIDMSRHVTLLKSDQAYEEHDEPAGNEEHQHGDYDPHYWLDIDNMIKMTQTLEAEFSKRFPDNAQMYHANATAYIAKLQKLKADYAQGLKECKNRTLISNHDAFGYLAHANALENISIIGLSSDEQPSANVIAQIIARIKEHGIKTIFFEEMIDDNVAQTIARETGAKAQSLQPLENISESELKSHQTYESIMRTNLAKLTHAMECR